jgi:sec-independent protein translocase protein TatC
MASLAVDNLQKHSADKTSAMSFLEHLEELRRRIVYSSLYLVAGFGVCWWFHEQIFAIMQKPITTALANHHMQQGLVYLNPTDPCCMW